MKIGLISDTVTRPTKGMLEAMMRAEVGDDVFNSDPSVNLLQEKAAKMFGMEAALFFPSGTMANQTAIKLHTQPGDKLFCDKWAHVYNYEGGGAAFNSGVSCKLIDGHRGMFTAEQLETAAAGRADIHVPYSRLVCIENTTNKGGGACWNFEEFVSTQEQLKKKNIGVIKKAISSSGCPPNTRRKRNTRDYERFSRRLRINLCRYGGCSERRC